MSPPGGDGGPSRRRVLRLAATATTGALAGCESLPGTGDGDGGTATDGAPPTRGTATTTATAVDSVTFDGGGAAAFAEALRTVEANPGSTLRIEPGTYHLNGLGVGPDYDQAHFVSYGLEDVTIDGTDAELVLEDARLGGLHLYEAEDVTVRGLTIDYETPAYALAAITAADEATRTVEVAVADGYPGFEEGVFASVAPDWATLHDPQTGNFLDSPCCGGSVLRFDEPEPLGDGRFRIPNLRPWRAIETGLDLVAVARVPQGSALQLVGCVEPLVEAVTVYGSPLLVAHVAITEAPVFRDVTARPRPGSGRPVVNTAGGVHVTNCHPGPTFEGCRFERLQDDAFTIAAKMHRVAGLVDDRTVDVDVVAATTIRPGDAIEAVGDGYERRGELPAVEESETGPRPGWPEGLGSPVEVTFAGGVADRLSAGDFLYNRSRANAGFVVRNCVVRDSRARHARITSRDGVVEGNEFDGSTSPSLLLNPNAVEPIANGPVENVTVRNNTITRAGLNGFTTPWPAAVLLWTDLERGRDETVPPGRPHRNVVVAGNAIRDVAHRAVHVEDARGVVVRDNVVERPNRRGKAENAYGFAFVNGRDVEVGGNRVVGSGESLSAFAVRTGTSGLETTGNAFVVDGSEQPVRVAERDSPAW